MVNLVIVESPAKAKTINKYLGKDYQVMASYGHVRDLPSKDGSVLPGEDFATIYEVDSDAERNVKAIAAATKKSDKLILATDPDREGEAISWHILEVLKERKALGKDTKVERVVFNEITKKAVQAAIAAPRDIDMSLVNAQQTRRILDYLVGFNISPVLWRKLPGSRSAGRVQSVALRLICERESEIEAFLPQEYWDVKVDLDKGGEKFTANLTHISGEKLDKFTLNNEEEANKAVSALEGKTYKVTGIEKKQTRRNPYAPFTTSTLQQEAFRKLGFGAKKTMRIAQGLYEGVDIDEGTVGLITYMRTDGVQVAAEAISATRDLIGKNFGQQYLPASPRLYEAKAKNAQEAHEAIRPTDPFRTPDKMRKFLNGDDFLLYELIWKRLVASQMQSAVLDLVIAEIETNDRVANLRATGSTLKFDGFLKLYREVKEDEEEEDDDRSLPELSEGDEPKLLEIKPAQHFTEPPPRYSEASLVKKMEDLGIGRPSTYASIISILLDREYVKMDRKKMVPEERGRIVTSFLESFFDHYVEYDFTAKLEGDLDAISNGEIDWKEVLRMFWKDFSGAVEEAKKLKITDVINKIDDMLGNHIFPVTKDNPEPRKCPSCSDGRLGIKLSKFGAFIGCSKYPECNYTKNLERPLTDEQKAVEEAQQEEGAAPKERPNSERVEPKILGKDENGQEVSLRKGPYGWYIQLGVEKKPKRSALPKNLNPQEIDLAKALALLKLPREIGKHPEDGKIIKVGIGRFGPYIQHNSKYKSLGKDDDVLTVGINRAVDLLSQVAEKKKIEPLKVLGTHPEDGKEIAIYDGKYGAYVKWNKVNATVPKDSSVDSVTLESALELLSKKSGKSGKKRLNKLKKKG